MLNKLFRPKLIIGTLPQTLTNGTTADASNVMSDLNYIVNQVNANAAPINNPTFTGTLTAGTSHFTGVSTLDSGVILSSTAGDTVITRSHEGNWTSNLTGAVTVSQTIYFSRIGRKVTLTMQAARTAGASSATTIDLSGMPSYLYPIANIYVLIPLVTDNGSDQAAPGVLLITSLGVMTVYKNVALANFTSSANTTGFYGWTAEYYTGT